MASEYERVFLQLASEVPFSVKGMLIASQVRRENFGIARSALAETVSALQNIPSVDKQREAAIGILMQIWACGKVDFCQESLDGILTVLPPIEHNGLNDLFSFSLEYIRKGRDPYFLEALQPDIRLATEKLVSVIDNQQIKVSAKVSKS